MNQSAKAQEPSMEEILASIRRIIADDDARAPEPPAPAPPRAAAPPPPPKPAAPPPKPAAPPPKAAAPAAAPAADGPGMSQDDIDAMLAGFDASPKQEPAPAPAPPPPPANDILDLTESMAAAVAPPPASASFRTIDGNSDVVFSEPPPRAVEIPSAPERPLLSPMASAAVDSAFGALAQTVLVQNARTLEDLVKEMLRPMLKAWLDDNLPGLVERIVKAEIERVSRGRTS
jgi:cell pole-organizing protein PopZ